MSRSGDQSRPSATTESPAHFRPGPGVVAQEADDGLILISLDSGTAFRLNATGKVVWQLASQGRSCPEIVELVARIFADTAADIQRDVGQVLDQLVHQGLLEVVTGVKP
jgi:Coenzyme PQQ synthesis protein D (PqqD)